MSEDDTVPATEPAAPRAQAGETKLVQVDPSRYALGAEIARGGMGRIIGARDLRHERPVAIKELTSGDDRRFEREALITAALQHPAIVPVYEAGRWPDGAPFYAMKLVDGEPLDRAIAARATLAERIALVPNVIAAADALAYSHERGVIHRDLKPANVLIGRFGETYVIDWGLAKRVDVAEDDAPSLQVRAEPADSTVLTVAGEVMGTPIYMPPEQAAGETVDRRADVYALGAMLYHVLAGVPPYEPGLLEEMLARVAAEPPVPLATRAAEIPEELIAIVDKAMSRDRSARYANAEQLAADLRRFQAGQLVLAHDYSIAARIARFVREHVYVFAGLALIAVAGIVFAIQRGRVLRERERAELEVARAEAAREHANALVDTLQELTPKLRRLGRLDLLDHVASSLITRYEAHDRTEPAEHRGYGIALLVHGYVQLLHRTRVAFDAPQTLQRARTELGLVPDDLAAQASLLEVWTDLALSDLTPGDRLGDANRGVALAERLAAAKPDDAHVTRAWAKLLCARAGVHADEGGFADASADIDRAKALVAPLAAPRDDDGAADDSEVAVEIGNAIGWLENQRGHEREARQAYDGVRARAAEALARGFDAQILDRQAEAARWSCTISEQLEDHAAARAACDEAQRIASELVATDRTNVESLSDLSEAHLATANLGGDDAQHHLDAALQIAKQLDPEYEADVHRDVAKWGVAHHDWPRARDEADAALAMLRQVGKANDTPVVRRIGWNLSTAGNARLALGDLDGAQAQFEQELAITTRLAAAQPDARPLQSDLADCKLDLARVQLARHHGGEARSVLADAIAIRERIAAQDPDDADNRDSLAELRKLASTSM